MPIETQVAGWWLLEAALPGRGGEPIGVLLHEPAADSLHLKLRRDWEAIAGEDDAEVLRALADDLDTKARELGASALLGLLEDTLSNAIRLSERREVMAADPERALARLYREHVPASVLPFRTHLPRYTLRVAAGKFLDNDEVGEEGWEEAPADLRLTPDLFVARIVGHSMEPQIPGDSLVVFRAGVQGSRQGRLVLVEDLATGGTNRYTVKRYRSEKASRTDGEWRHTRVRLESLNPDYPSWDLDPNEEKYRIVAEFERVLE
ncbi:MAG: S24 family peptidase [Bryobacteraceae bacterium]|jgi:SOS-response transcriptional repressor LexA